ncbi:MAG: anti-sigma factor family protein [Actinomycetota bacterium]
MPELHNDVEVHLATCSECAGELAQYREVMHAVALLRDELEPVPAGFTDRIVTRVLEPARWVDRAVRVVRDRRVHVAAASFGGAIIGAGAVALILWRAARRGVPRTA